jgi:hypothetical protein
VLSFEADKGDGRVAMIEAELKVDSMGAIGLDAP